MSAPVLVPGWTTPVRSPGPAGVGFVAGLRDHGDRVAVIDGAAELTYSQLADRVDRTSAELGAGRRLVLVEAANDLTSLVGYLAALRGGHVALLAARSDPAQRTDLVATFDPDTVVGADGSVHLRRDRPRRDLHPDLALLMTTSGSTGTPRLVRLPATALDANAAAIAEYLDITCDDRPVLSLPMHYCYGLSVVNSNLLRGAALVLSDRSVAEPEFWDTVREQRATSLHGVPYTFDLLDRVGFESMSLPHLRYVTQAGGRLDPDRIRYWAATGQRHGWQLFVMYGQTEATARMAYLPPELAGTDPDAIGRPIPGGSLTIESVDGAGPVPDGEVGEIVYRGPNVMLGYAATPDDLTLGRTVRELHTGDLGRRRPDGLFEVVGRRSRFVKPFGIRIDLDGIEHLLAVLGFQAACTGTDDRLVVAVKNPAIGTADTGRMRALLAERLRLPAGTVTVIAVGDLPRRPNGKLDHAAVAALAGPATPEATGATRWRHRFRRRPTRTVREVFTRTFPGQELDDGASFVDLGGDSLTFVQVSTDIERALGRLPQSWDRMPLGELAALEPRRSVLASLESAVVLRAIAVVLVIGDHAHLWTMLGGAHLLLAVSGWTFARFILDDGPDPRSCRTSDATTTRILRSTARIAVPSVVWIAFRALAHNVRFVDALLVGSLLPPIVRGYWYIDALVQTLLMLAILFAVPAVRRLDRRYPFGLPATLLLVTSIGRFFPVGYADWFVIDIYSTQVVAWLFVLGWLVQRVRTQNQQLFTVAAVLLLVPSFFGTDVQRAVIVTVGTLVLLLLPRIAVPRALAAPISLLASASLGIYLTHFALLPLEDHGVPPAVLVPMALVVGVASWTALTAAGRRITTARAATSRSASTSPEAAEREKARV